jgi:cytochrome c oxidase subunit 2
MLSTLDTAGRDAQQIAFLFWVMAAGAAVIWAGMTLLALYSMRERREQWSPARGYRLIVGGGVVLPTVVLSALLAAGMPSLTRLLDPPRAGTLTIAVSGEQWWWRVRYANPSGAPVELANEIRLPVGERTEVRLASDNVIHSFWIPSISGKVDMIPGRTTRLSLEPTRTGTFRGTCAEYCGASHALMGFSVAVMEKAAFTAWLAEQSRDALEPATPEAIRGRELFSANGCSACHSVRGTRAAGVVGPDLTHAGGRLTLAAAALPNDTSHLVDWIARPHRAKPGALMPPFGMLPLDDLHALAAYVSGLK